MSSSLNAPPRKCKTFFHCYLSFSSNSSILCLSFFLYLSFANYGRQRHRQLVRSIPRLSAPACHLLGKINAMRAFFSTRHLCLQPKWQTMMEITDVLQRRMFPLRLFCPVDGSMVLSVQGWSALAVYDPPFVFTKQCK